VRVLLPQAFAMAQTVPARSVQRPVVRMLVVAVADSPAEVSVLAQTRSTRQDKEKLPLR